MSDVDVVIIGAGAAGLAAAMAAQQKGLTTILLEGSHRIGGRAYTEEMAPGVPFDLGCHWMHSGSLNPFVPIADRLGFHYHKGGPWKPTVHTPRGWADAAEQAAIIALGEANEAAMKALVARGEDVAVADVVDHDHPWAAFQAYWFTLYTSRDMDQVSATDVMAYADTGENWPLREGYGALVTRWAADVPVTLNAAATRVSWGRNGVSVETPKGTIRGRRLVVTVSTNMLTAGRIAFDPPLPAWKIEAATQLPLGVHNRIGIKLNHDPFGPDAPPSITVFSKEDEPPMAIQLRPFGHDYVVGVTGGRFGAWLEYAGMAASIEHLTNHLVNAFGSDIRRALSDRTIVTAWAGDPWTLGSYSSATPGNSRARAELARPIDDVLYFAGEASSPDFFSTCHGAYLSGIAAIEKIAKAPR
ncbi:MAG TPA: NAD(P)/FAD-dependent oxidoreductase [Dongiaceae bacterium]|nr:NAD(P)/FAD-dependent oxidoreductase [Dongiaceae bacterium]